MSAPVFTLYRFFDQSGALLYVGRTINAQSRWRSHERTKEWFASVATVTREVYLSAEDLDLAERQAITTENPRHNIALNPAAVRNMTPAPILRAEPTRDWDDLLSARQKVWGVVDSCEDQGAGIESSCECRACHAIRMRELDGLEDNYIGDERVAALVAELRRRYIDGWDLIDWVYDLLDIELFRPMELAALSRVQPAPVACTRTEVGIQVGCPFCQNLHEHFLAKGDAIAGPLAAPCSRGGYYTPHGDVFDALNAYSEWLDLERAS